VTSSSQAEHVFANSMQNRKLKFDGLPPQTEALSFWKLPFATVDRFDWSLLGSRRGSQSINGERERSARRTRRAASSRRLDGTNDPNGSKALARLNFFYCKLLATVENALFAFPPIKRIVPMTELCHSLGGEFTSLAVPTQ
jgi:hypothetical protein